MLVKRLAGCGNANKMLWNLCKQRVLQGILLREQEMNLIIPALSKLIARDHPRNAVQPVNCRDRSGKPVHLAPGFYSPLVEICQSETAHISVYVDMMKHGF